MTYRKISDGQGEVRGFSVNNYKRCGIGVSRRRKTSANSMRQSISRKVSSCTAPFYASSFGLRSILLIVLAYFGRWTDFSKSVPLGFDPDSGFHLNSREGLEMFVFRDDVFPSSHPQQFFRYIIVYMSLKLRTRIPK